jgi:hypothetical protein
MATASSRSLGIARVSCRQKNLHKQDQSGIKTKYIELEEF